MRRSLSRRLLSLLLILAVMLTSTVPALAWETRETDLFDKFPQEVDFTALDYGTPDTSAMEAICAQVLQFSEEPGQADAIVSLLNQLDEEYIRLYTNYCVFYIHHSQDPQAHAEEYPLWDALFYSISTLYIETLQTVLSSPNREAAVQVLGEEDAAAIAALTVDTPEEQALLNRCSELVNQYWLLVSEDTPLQYQGLTLRNLDELAAAYINGDIDYNTYCTLYRDMTKQASDKIAPVYVEMVNLYNQYAAGKGCQNYAEYSYAKVWYRDYTPEDAAALSASVRENLTDMIDLLKLVNGNPAFQDGSAALNQLFSGSGQDELLDMAEAYMGCISSEFSELFSYMRRCSLVDIAPSETKSEQGYTITLPAYDSAFIFHSPYGSSEDLSTLIHEFGHFAEDCLSDGSDAEDCIDLSEINSQGLELLYFPYLGELLEDESAADTYRLKTLYRFIYYSIFTGCLFDEFQQAVYQEKDLTVDEIPQIFSEMITSYGIMDPDLDRYDWYQVSHTFAQPFYYISYATSAMAALELWEDSLTDYDDACRRYLELTDLGCSGGFRQTLSQVGIGDVFLPESTAELAESLEEYILCELCGAAFSDISDAGTLRAARLCAALGWFQGTGDGAFSPDAPLTRAQAVTVLWRICGCPQASVSASFADVPEGVWYTDALNWAVEAGVILGTEDGRFSPNSPVTCQALYAMLYRFAGCPETDSASLSGGENFSTWALDAAAWLAGLGLLTESSGSLEPASSMTRGGAAELLTALYVG